MRSITPWWSGWLVCWRVTGAKGGRVAFCGLDAEAGVGDRYIRHGLLVG